MDAVTSASATTQSTTSSSSSGSTVNSDYETFLLMLTTQLQNQDPLDPMDNSEYAEQLATFSGVEQQVKTNDLLTELGALFGTMSFGQLASWVGMEVRSTGPVQFEGSPLELYPTVPAAADYAELVVSDSRGTIVQRQTFDPKAETIIWAGVDAIGQALGTGTFSFAVQPSANGSLLDMQVVESFSRVTEVQSKSGSTMLVLSGGIEQPADSISALREPKSP